MRKLRLGVVGTEEPSDIFLEAVKEFDNIEFIAVYAPEEGKGLFFAEKHGITRVAITLKALVGEQLDIVYIGSYNGLHYKQAKYLLSKGVHLIIENPITLKASELQDLYNIAMKNNVYFIEGISCLHHTHLKEVRKLVLTEKLGKVRHVNFNAFKHASGYEDFKQENITPLFDPLLGGGATYEMGVYPIHMALYCFGEPDKILAYNTRKLNSEVDLLTNMIFEYENFNINICSSIVAESTAKNEIICEDGNIVFDSFYNIKEVFTLQNSEMTYIFDEEIKNEIKLLIEQFVKIIIDENLDAFEKYYVMSLKACKIVDDIYRQIGN